MKKTIITVVGKDTVGIIAKVCTYLAENRVNILDISQTIVDGYFNMMMITDTSLSPKKLDTLSGELEEVGRIMAGHPNIKGLEVLPYHNMGEGKYEELNLSYPLKGMKNLSRDEAARARKIILKSFQRHRLPSSLS